MSYIKNYKMFLEEFVMSSPRPGTIETPVETPVTPALPIPTEIPDEQDNPLAVKSSPRPGTIETPVETPVTPALPIPTEIPDEQDNPLAKAEDVINRLSNLYSKEDRKGKSEIDSYFEEK